MNDQDSRSRRKGTLDTLNDVYTAVSRARQGFQIAGMVAANFWVIIGVASAITLFVFILTFTGGEAAGIPGSGTEVDRQASTSTPSGKDNSLTCSIGGGLCSPENLSAFGSNATTASKICKTESGGVSTVINKNCLKGISVDYSVGLFQFNMMAQCAQAFSCLDTNTKDGPGCPGGTYCVIGNQAVLDDCARRFSDVSFNIQQAVSLSKGGSDWSHWGAAYACGIL